MSSTPPTAGRVIDIGSQDWCWWRVGTEGEGIMSFKASRGFLSLAVPYAVDDRQITIALAPFNDVGWLADGVETRIEVMGSTRDQLRWVVRATSTAQRVNRARSSGQGSSPRSYPDRVRGSAPVSPDHLILRSPRIRGFYETAVDTA